MSISKRRMTKPNSAFIDIIMRVCVKILHIQSLEIRGEQPQIKVPMKAFGNSLLSSLSVLVKSIEEEIQLS